MGFWAPHARTAAVVALTVAALGSCKRASSTESAPAPEEATECEAYASDYERCLRTLAPEPATAARLAENTRLSLRSAVVDEASRIRVNDQCRVARDQLRRSCQ
jgi:hypothetical protein